MEQFPIKETMSSLQIAEISGKQHKDVMRAIRKMEPAWEKVYGCKFVLTSQLVDMPNGGTKRTPCYNLTKTECLFIATKFNDEARAKLVLRWEQLEKHTLPSYQEQDPIKRAELWITEQKERQQLLLEAQAKQQQIEVQSAQIKELNHAVEEMQPKVSYLDLIMNDKRTLTVTQIAQDYGISAKAFNKILESYHVQRKVNGVWIVYAPYLKEGYVTSQTGQKGTHSDGTPFIYQYTAWTYKGRAFLYQQLKKKGILPTIERNS